MDTAKALTMHVVVAFSQTADDITADPPLQMMSTEQAKNRARILMANHVGVIAWSRTYDPETGDYSDPVILARHGTIPDWFSETGDAGG